MQPLSRFTRSLIKEHSLPMGHIAGVNPRKERLTTLPGVKTRMSSGRMHLGMGQSSAPLKHEMAPTTSFGIEGPEEGMPA